MSRSKVTSVQSWPTKNPGSWNNVGFWNNVVFWKFLSVRRCKNRKFFISLSNAQFHPDSEYPSLSSVRCLVSEIQAFEVGRKTRVPDSGERVSWGNVSRLSLAVALLSNEERPVDYLSSSTDRLLHIISSTWACNVTHLKIGKTHLSPILFWFSFMSTSLPPFSTKTSWIWPS